MKEHRFHDEHSANLNTPPQFADPAFAELLPWPQELSVNISEETRNPTPSASGLSLEWEGEPNELVQRRAQSLLGAGFHGRLRLCVADGAQTLPSFGVDESYTLEWQAGEAKLVANTQWGALHGLTTLNQLDLSQTQAADIVIRDASRFPWRGLLLDVARHFISISKLKRVLDGMSRLKLNVLHLHLSDDQAFRFASTRFPKLASAESYTASQLHELVAYAGTMGIRVVPEIDMPGHVTSWLVAYPQWGINTVESSSRFGVHKACLNPCDEAVYEAIDELLGEVCEIFPDTFVHIGGDEVHPQWWHESDTVQRFIAEQQLVDERGLQAYFNRRVYEMLAKRGRGVLGWDEVLHPDMPPLLVQNWRGATTRDRTLKMGLDCIISSGYYLDLHYPAGVHYAWDPLAPQDQLLSLEDGLKEDLRFEHVAQGMGWTEQWRAEAVALDDDGDTTLGQVLGGEACLWSELVDESTLEVRLWSRLPAVAERLWSAGSLVDETFFYARLERCLASPELSVLAQQQSALASMGLEGPMADALMMLEPVKWYARLLGETAYRARLMGREMPQARPYDVQTPLNRVVDVISPESLPARALKDCDQETLLKIVGSWIDLDEQLFPEDVQPAIRALMDLGEITSRAMQQAWTAPDLTAALLPMYQPYGEYVLAPIPAILGWLNEA